MAAAGAALRTDEEICGRAEVERILAARAGALAIARENILMEAMVGDGRMYRGTERFES